MAMVLLQESPPGTGVESTSPIFPSPPAMAAEFTSEAPSSRLIKQANKAAAQEAQVLLNRLKLLKKEEAKALRIVECSQKKLEWINKMREEREREQSANLKIIELNKQRVANARRKWGEGGVTAAQTPGAAPSGTVAATSVNMEKHKKESAARVKREKERAQKELQEAKAARLQCNRQKNSAIRKKEAEARERRAVLAIEAERKSRLAYQEKTKREEKELRARERQLARLEQDQIVMLERLRMAQELQLKACQELEMASRGTTVTSPASPSGRSKTGRGAASRRKLSVTR